MLQLHYRICGSRKRMWSVGGGTSVSEHLREGEKACVCVREREASQIWKIYTLEFSLLKCEYMLLQI